DRQEGAARPVGGGESVTWQDPELRTDYAPAEAEHPGEYPFTRGVSPEPKVWIMGQYAGFGTAKESNERFRSLLDAGVTGFSVAMDLPSQMGKIGRASCRERDWTSVCARTGSEKCVNVSWRFMSNSQARKINVTLTVQ